MASSIKFSPKLFAVALCAAYFSCLSCSNGDSDTSGDGAGVTETYAIQNITESSFTILETYYSCYDASVWNSQGELEVHNYSDIVNYAIDNRTLDLSGGGPFYESIQFNGTSTSLTGTWTRTPGTCEPDYDNYIYCDGDDITKVVFTNNSLQVTQNICPSRWLEEEAEYLMNEYGAVASVSNCNNYTVSKGSDKISVNLAITGRESGNIRAIYNNKPACSAVIKEPTFVERQAACRAAYSQAAAEGGDRYDMEEYYYDIIEADITRFYNCLVEAGAPTDLIRAIL